MGPWGTSGASVALSQGKRITMNWGRVDVSKEEVPVPEQGTHNSRTAVRW